MSRSGHIPMGVITKVIKETKFQYSVHDRLVSIVVYGDLCTAEPELSKTFHRCGHFRRLGPAGNFCFYARAACKAETTSYRFWRLPQCPMPSLFCGSDGGPEKQGSAKLTSPANLLVACGGRATQPIGTNLRRRVAGERQALPDRDKLVLIDAHVVCDRS
jgi:hypothetical protein